MFERVNSRAYLNGSGGLMRRKNLTKFTNTEDDSLRRPLTRVEAAKICGLSLATFDEGIRQGKIPFQRVGRRVLIPRKAFQRFLDGELGK